MDDDRHDVIELSRRYITQQAELGGSEFFFQNANRSLKGSFSSQQDVCFWEESLICRRCRLAQTRKHIVWGEGNRNASLMLVGEAPGREEDLQGKPFVGQAGRLLNNILKAIGFERKEVYITNILKCRPPENRDPLPDEIKSCLPILEDQILRIGPKVILTLGRYAGQTLLMTADPLNRLRGKFHDRGGIPCRVTYHPAALLRNPQWKRPVWEDVQALRILYDQIVGDKPPWSPHEK
ncbi:MAG TPA: uracil-DNA glycosylase [bacterium]|mgnify:CR=1 FL=1|nr:uracil-DNA glycosylase [bacterium]